MKAAILSIGDELVLGQTLDTNTAWIAAQLAAIGIDIIAHATVGDSQADIERMIREAAERADVVVISGGIGPTEDDVTRQALAAVLGSPLVKNDAWMKHLTEWFAKLGRVMPAINEVQALIPTSAAMIWNQKGTAAGIAATIGNARVYSMPGVPKEMKAMFETSVLPELAKASGGATIVQWLLHTFGLGESTVGERLGDLMRRGRNPSVGTTVSGGIVSIRVNARADSVNTATLAADETSAAVRAAIGDAIFGEDSDTLATVVSTALRDAAATGRPHSVATAESCTGGLLAKVLTDVGGSSVYFQQGWVTYTNESKTNLLGVDAGAIAADGAVSETVARAMAVGARTRANADFGIGITGIAGPGGGTETKPVGTVCIALAHADGITVRTFIFHGDREMIRDRSAKMALWMLRLRLMGRVIPA